MIDLEKKKIPYPKHRYFNELGMYDLDRQIKDFGVLDVACGLNPKGNVNIDSNTEATTHRGVSSDIALKPKEISNFVKADMHYLPFQDKIFDLVRCFHALEHTFEPQKVFSELVRVSKDKILIEIPHRFAEHLHLSLTKRRWVKRHHVSKFTVKYVALLCSKYNCKLVKTKEIDWYYIPHFLVPIIRFPSIIRCFIQKNKV